uniref:Uncharacterized protein n=1 Tax=Plectus sambesii TaxID=2011161 RepID=A0A914VIJ7_9BILA
MTDVADATDRPSPSSTTANGGDHSPPHSADFEFRPSASAATKKGRSKSPGALMERLQMFARGRNRHSLNERDKNKSGFEDRPKR